MWLQNFEFKKICKFNAQRPFFIISFYFRCLHPKILLAMSCHTVVKASINCLVGIKYKRYN